VTALFRSHLLRWDCAQICWTLKAYLYRRWMTLMLNLMLLPRLLKTLLPLPITKSSPKEQGMRWRYVWCAYYFVNLEQRNYVLHQLPCLSLRIPPFCFDSRFHCFAAFSCKDRDVFTSYVALWRKWLNKLVGEMPIK